MVVSTTTSLKNSPVVLQDLETSESATLSIHNGSWGALTWGSLRNLAEALNGVTLKELFKG
eukprot:3418843-Amphidinium_carterae.1